MDQQATEKEHGHDSSTPVNPSIRELTLTPGQTQKIIELQSEFERLAKKRDGESKWQTVLQYACYEGKELDLITILIARGDDVNAAHTNSKWTPLHWASANGHTEIVNHLLQNEARVNHIDSRGWTALHWACFHGHGDAARLLIEEGAHVNAASSDVWYEYPTGSTPLHVASYRGYHRGMEDVIKVLLGNNADRQLKNANGQTAMEVAKSTVLHLFNE